MYEQNLRNYTDLKIYVEIKDGRVIVSGREYLTEHCYLTNFYKASLRLSDDIRIVTEYKKMPQVNFDEYVAKIGLGEEVLVNDPVILSVQEDAGKYLIVVENLDLKITDENNLYKVVFEKWKTFTHANIQLTINNGEDTVMNVITRPFISIWIYSSRKRRVTVEKTSNNLDINIDIT